MKRIFTLLLIVTGLAAHAQSKETFDVINYTRPAGWKKEAGTNVMSYVLSNAKLKTWCRITIVKSTASKGDLAKDFDNEWQELVVKNYDSVDVPQVTEAQQLNGWEIKAGLGKFTFGGAPAIALLTTASGYERCASVVAITNNADYLSKVDSFLSSIDLKNPGLQSTPPPDASIPNNTDPGSTMVGIWGKTSTNNASYEIQNGLWGYITCQYTLKKDGTYIFIKRSASYLSEILVTRESGTYQVAGNVLTIIPKKGVIERWTKATAMGNNGKKVTLDKLGELLLSQPLKLEKISYTFSKNYLSGTQEWQLLLVGTGETQRDGPFNGSSYYPNTWFYKAITSDALLVKTD